MDVKIWLVFWLCLDVTLNSFVFGISSFSPLTINIDVDAQISVCHFTMTTEPTPSVIAICGFKGETCSIAAYFNQSEAQLQKTVNCDCWDVFSDTDQAIIPGKRFRNHFYKCAMYLILLATHVSSLEIEILTNICDLILMYLSRE